MPEVIRNNRSFVAGADLSSSQFLFVTLNSSGNIVVAGNGANSIGVLQDKPGSGEPGSVCGPGDQTQVQAGGSFAAGDPISSNGSGKAILSVTGAYLLGYAQTAGASGSNAFILFQPRGSVR